MATREIILTAELSQREDSKKRVITLPTSILRKLVWVKWITDYLKRHALALACLAGCIALNLHWGENGFLFLALPYAMIWDHLDNDK